MSKKVLLYRYMVAYQRSESQEKQNGNVGQQDEAFTGQQWNEKDEDNTVSISWSYIC